MAMNRGIVQFHYRLSFKKGSLNEHVTQFLVYTLLEKLLVYLVDLDSKRIIFSPYKLDSKYSTTFFPNCSADIGQENLY